MRLTSKSAPEVSGYSDKLSYNNSPPAPRRRKRKRNIIWFNPPFNKSVQTNIGKSFLLLVQKHFRPNHKFHNIFNKNKLNSKYGNNKVIRTDPKNTQDTCRKKNKERIQPSPKLKPTTSYPKIATYVLQRGFILWKRTTPTYWRKETN